MLQQLRQSLLKPDKIAALYIQSTDNVALTIHYCLVEFKKGKAYIVKKGQFSQLEELPSHIETSTPLIISLNGKGVLHKTIDAALLNNDKIHVAGKLFPNINIDDFFIQTFQMEKSGILSLVRNDQVFPYIEKITKQGFSIYALVLGEYEILAYESIFHNNHFDNNSLITASKDCLQLHPQTNIDGKNLQQYEYVAFCLILSYVSGSLQHTENKNIVEVKELSEEKIIFNKGGIVLLGFIFVILMVNFVIFQFLSDKHNALQEKQLLLGGKINKYKELEDKLKRKQQLLQEIGWSETSHASFYADRIGATIPKGLRLTNMQIHAEDQQKSKEERRLVLEAGKINVKGESASAMLVNDWQKTLEKQKWVANAKVKSYQYDIKERIGKFEIEINVSN